MRYVLLLAAGLALSGCGPTLAEIERSDDATCRGATDYTVCRANIMSLRRDRAIRSQ